jgi:hypothetical protein
MPHKNITSHPTFDTTTKQRALVVLRILSKSYILSYALALRIRCTYFFEVANKDCKYVEKTTKNLQIFRDYSPKT